jgi:hypothetical protein
MTGLFFLFKAKRKEEGGASSLMGKFGFPLLFGKRKWLVLRYTHAQALLSISRNRCCTPAGETPDSESEPFLSTVRLLYGMSRLSLLCFFTRFSSSLGGIFEDVRS